jgi:hypothetical protein
MLPMTLVITALAVSARAPAQDVAMKGLAPEGLPTVTVLDDRGVETRGRLISLDRDAVILLVGTEQRRVDTARVTRVSRRGDPVRNGTIAGAAFGMLVGLVGAGLSECSDDRGRISGCGAATRAALVAGSTAFYTAIGAGLDALVEGETVIYQAPGGSGTAKRAAVGFTLRW